MRHETWAQRRQRKQKAKTKRDVAGLSSCQRLIKCIDESEAEYRRLTSGRYDRPPPSRLLDLPAEIRQLILCHAIEDDDTRHGPGKQSVVLSGVCATFRADLPAARMLRTKMNAELSTTTYSTCAGELMEILNRTAAANTSIMHLRKRKRRSGIDMCIGAINSIHYGVTRQDKHIGRMLYGWSRGLARRAQRAAKKVKRKTY